METEGPDPHRGVEESSAIRDLREAREADRASDEVDRLRKLGSPDRARPEPGAELMDPPTDRLVIEVPDRCGIERHEVAVRLDRRLELGKDRGPTVGETQLVL